MSKAAAGSLFAGLCAPWTRLPASALPLSKHGRCPLGRLPLIADEYLSDLLILISSRKTGPIFLSNRNRLMAPRLVNHIVATLGTKAGVINPNPRLTHLNPHLFRHSIARFLKSKGFSAEWIQNFLGHESYKTTMDMYGTLSIDEMQEVAARLLD